ATSDLCSIPQSVGIKTVRVNGADAAAVHEAAAGAAAQCRAGEGPVFIEAVIKRWPGSNPLWPELATGITDVRLATGEAKANGEHDPILLLARSLAEDGGKQRLYDLDRDVRARIATAVKFALESPLPSADTAFDHVYA